MQKTITCPTCDGRGRGLPIRSCWPRGYWQGDICEDCKGSGQVGIKEEWEPETKRRKEPDFGY